LKEKTQSELNKIGDEKLLAIEPIADAQEEVKAQNDPQDIFGDMNPQENYLARLQDQITGIVRSGLQRIAKLDEQRTKDEVMLNEALEKCSQFSTFMKETQSQMAIKTNLDKLMVGLEQEVVRLTEKVEKDQGSQNIRNMELVQNIEDAFQFRLEEKPGLGVNGPVSLTMTEFRGLKAGHTKIVSFPEFKDIEGCSIDELPLLEKVEYDIGTHIRCIKFSTSDGRSSEKAGGFNLDKVRSIKGEDIGRIEVQTLSNDGKVGRLAFYDRQKNLLLDLKGSYGLNADKHVTELGENEVLAGFEIFSNEYVVMGASFKIAKYA